MVKRTVVWDFVPGTVLFEVTDPDLDDNGPGNYAYPTSADFHAGAFDMQRFQVIDSGADIVFRVQTRDLTPTFGSPLGAQLIDVYVHDPAAAPADTSTAASFPQRNYVIAPGAAWSRLIEVQGFGQRYVDAHGTALGTVSIRANQLSRFITFSVPKATLGTPDLRMGVHRCAHRTGRFQPGPGPSVHADARSVRLRRVRDPRAATRTAPSTPAPSPRPWTSSRRTASRSRTNSTTPCTPRS